ncbi:MAG TPA: DNA primase [Phycisphaerae bacterium]
MGEHVALKRAGRDLAGLCPFHQEKTPSFHVSPAKGIFKCFGCGAGGDIFTFVQLREKVDFREALRILADRAGIELTVRRSSSGVSEISRSDLARVNAWAAEFYRRQYLDDRKGAAARAYVTGRAISAQTAEAFKIGLAVPDSHQISRAAKAAGIDGRLLAAAGLTKQGESGEAYDAFRTRLIFPIRDTMGRCVGFGGRALDDSPAKYLNTAQSALFDKSRCLFGLDLARQAIEATGRVVVVEGYFDCVAAHQAGVRETVATMGTAMTEQHADILRRYCGQIVLVFDSDAAGVRAADRAVAVTVKYGLDIRIARVGEKDPADFLQTHAPEEFINLLNSAEDALGFRWRQLLAQSGGGGNIRDRWAATVEFLRWIAAHFRAGAVDAIQKGLIGNQVARLLGLRPEEVHRQFEEAASGRTTSPGASRPERSVGTIVSREAPASAEEIHLRIAVALLLSEPALWPQVKPVFDTGLIEDERLRRVATRTGDLAEQVGEFAITELIDELHDPEDVALATDLALWAERQGVAVGATLEGVVRRLEEFTVQRQARFAARQLGEHPADCRQTLETVQAACQQHKFVSRGWAAGTIRP